MHYLTLRFHIPQSDLCTQIKKVFSIKKKTVFGKAIENYPIIEFYPINCMMQENE